MHTISVGTKMKKIPHSHALYHSYILLGPFVFVSLVCAINFSVPVLILLSLTEVQMTNLTDQLYATNAGKSSSVM